MLVDNLNAGRPQCPVGLNTLVVPRQGADQFKHLISTFFCLVTIISAERTHFKIMV